MESRGPATRLHPMKRPGLLMQVLCNVESCETKHTKPILLARSRTSEGAGDRTQAVFSPVIQRWPVGHCHRCVRPGSNKAEDPPCNERKPTPDRWNESRAPVAATRAYEADSRSLACSSASAMLNSGARTKPLQGQLLPCQLQVRYLRHVKEPVLHALATAAVMAYQLISVSNQSFLPFESGSGTWQRCQKICCTFTT